MLVPDGFKVHDDCFINFILEKDQIKYIRHNVTKIHRNQALVSFAYSTTMIAESALRGSDKKDVETVLTRKF